MSRLIEVSFVPLCSTLRYLTDAPYNMTIYSADFIIVVRGDSIPGFRSPLGPFSNSSATTGLVSSSTYVGLATASQPSSPPLPPPPPSVSVSVSESESSEPTTSIVIPPPRPSDVGNTTVQPSPAGKKNKNSAPGRLDTEKLKFRLVFILWPAALGITLAL